MWDLARNGPDDVRFQVLGIIVFVPPRSRLITHQLCASEGRLTAKQGVGISDLRVPISRERPLVGFIAVGF